MAEHTQSTDTRSQPAPPAPDRRVRWWKPLAALLALAAGFALLTRTDLLPGVSDLFAEETHDRSGPTLLQSIQDMSRYQAATGNFQVVVDLEKDAKYLPDAIRGTRTLYVGAGTVDAHVDLGSLSGEHVSVNEDRTAATLTLPPAQLAAPSLDAERSYAVTKERGLLDRLGDLFSDNPGDERAVRALAVDHIAAAAKESDLTARAEDNTRTMLTGLLTSLGFQNITITFTPS
ncbi:DUF4230 domain-containing protein [Streptomyces sp. JJ66]|uniref:DUF4230 domain-containing protein n=1 Tax=Streptomyces sp. JJ66 TaxID=2803843 RepID=UPI001C5990EE|nr:DUF4230 domain-containing protein [Streptomyces sp. JJ66]MBW1603646.1 DUF4230 domain-containing protein [Streptomyces sp. JJ66]